MVRNVKPALIENCGIYSTHILIPPYTYTVGNLNDNKYFGREGGGKEFLIMGLGQAPILKFVYKKINKVN